MYSGALEYTQLIKLSYDMLKYICSNKRREKYRNILLKDYIIENYNENTYDVTVNHLAGCCLGFNRNTVSIDTIVDTITKVLIHSNMDNKEGL